MWSLDLEERERAALLEYRAQRDAGYFGAVCTVRCEWCRNTLRVGFCEAADATHIYCSDDCYSAARADKTGRGRLGGR